MEHTVRAYDTELADLGGDLRRLGGLARAQLGRAIDAFARRDLKLAQDVVAADEELDLLDAAVEHKAVRLIALRQPVAEDLRNTVSGMKIAGELERCGDLAKNIAKRVAVIAASPPDSSITTPVEEMARLVHDRLSQVLDAFETGDVDAAMSVWSDDREVDERYDGVFRELLAYMSANPDAIGACAHLLFVAKNLERIGDHATNMAELIYYRLTGQELSTPRPKLDSLSPNADD